MAFSFLSVDSPDLLCSSGSSDLLAVETPGNGFQTLPEFVKSFANGNDPIVLALESMKDMLSKLEKSELVALLAMAVMQSEDVRTSVGYSLSNMTTYRRLLVRNIAFHATTEDVKELLQSRYGLIEEGSVVYDRATEKSKGFAFMTFATVDSACNAIIDSNNGLIEMHGRTILLKFAADRGDSINTNTKTSSEAAASANCDAASSTSTSGRRLFVSALALETTSDSLAISMSQYGDMQECFVVSGPNGVSRRFGFVTFASDDSAWACLQQPVTVDGTLVSIQPAADRTGPSSAPRQSTLKRTASNPRSIHVPAPTTAAPTVDELVNNLLTGLDGKALSALWGDNSS
jgi:RNA recognition motif-containing protein